MFHKYFTQKFSQLPKEQKDVVQAGVEAWYHFCYETRNKNGRFDKYAHYANDGVSLKEKQELFTKGIQAEAVRLANLPDNTFSEHILRTHPTVQWVTFQLVSQTLDIIIPQTVLDNFYQFAEVRNVAWGDSLVFHIPNNDLFEVSTIANGIRRGGRQRKFNSDITLVPIRREVSIYEELYRIVSGKSDWGQWVARVAQSIETELTTDIYNAIVDSFTTLGSAYKVTGAFAQDDFNKLIQRVSAANGGAQVSVFGTKLALSQVVPSDQYFKFGLGDEYNRNGYLGNFQGTNMFELTQRLIANSDDFSISDNYLFVIASPVDKLVKIGFEGETEIYQNQNNDNADRSIEYSIAKHWDAKLATSAAYAVYELEND